jgi:hypothetical protein
MDYSTGLLHAGSGGSSGIVVVGMDYSKGLLHAGSGGSSGIVVVVVVVVVAVVVVVVVVVAAVVAVVVVVVVVVAAVVLSHLNCYYMQLLEKATFQLEMVVGGQTIEGTTKLALLAEVIVVVVVVLRAPLSLHCWRR